MAYVATRQDRFSSKTNGIVEIEKRQSERSDNLPPIPENDVLKLGGDSQITGSGAPQQPEAAQRPNDNRQTEVSCKEINPDDD